jgi:hypothetical protein
MSSRTKAIPLQAHNLKVTGSNPVPATNIIQWVRRKPGALVSLSREATDTDARFPQGGVSRAGDSAVADLRDLRNLSGFRPSLVATDPADDGVEGRREQEAERGHSEHAGEDGRAQ